MNFDFASLLARFRYGERLRPVRDWLVLLAAAFMFLLASIAWNAWIYIRVSRGEEIGSAPPPSSIDTNAIDAAEKVFSDRAAEEANYENAYHFVDPSK